MSLRVAPERVENVWPLAAPAVVVGADLDGTDADDAAEAAVGGHQGISLPVSPVKSVTWSASQRKISSPS